MLNFSQFNHNNITELKISRWRVNHQTKQQPLGDSSDVEGEPKAIQPSQRSTNDAEGEYTEP